MKEKELWDLIPEHPVLSNLKKEYSQIRKEIVPALEDFGSPHIESFDWFVEDGLQKAMDDLPPVNFELPSKDRISLKITGSKFSPPTVAPGSIGCRNFRVYPTECRQRYTSYKGQFTVQVSWWLNGVRQGTIEKNMGNIPIMVKSNVCNLRGMTPTQLVGVGEHETEFGGYFVVKGHEKLIRMLLMTRANFPHFLMRSNWEARGKNFTTKGVIMRCVREDRTSINNVFHYLSDGSVKVMFNVERELFFVPIFLILKALVDVTDEFVYKQAIAGFEDNIILKGYVTEMLRALHLEGIHTHQQAKIFLGQKFRSKFARIIGEWQTDSTCCDYLLDRGIAVHCKTPMEKFNIFIYCMQKLYAGVEGTCSTENPDHVMLQEVLLGGHLYLTLLKERLLQWLMTVNYLAIKKNTQNSGAPFTSADMIQVINSSYQMDRSFDAFLATGTVPPKTGLGLSQQTGLTIILENLNRNRYLAHFRSVHRGAFFQELRTTDARQLQPDAWGFICPVHTPDGTPCGLLNHLSTFCKVVTQPQNKSQIPEVLSSLGMIPVNKSSPFPLKDCYVCILDGVVLGYIWSQDASKIVDQLRVLKIEGTKVPNMTEIVLIRKKNKGQFPGLFLFTTLARMMRPVLNLKVNKLEYIGTLEQVYMDICIIPEEAYPGITTHQELNERMFMSHLASLIPMPDCNQSPRNMYQCQMGKQTMGTPYLTWHRFAENKLYRLMTPGAPLFRPVHHDYLQMDDYPSGTNAIVAVISYSGYDMEDSMIINKSSYERGLCHGCIYKSEHIEIPQILKNPNTQSIFMLDPKDPMGYRKYLGPDGLPHVGTPLDNNDPYYCYFNAEEGKYVYGRFKGAERAYVDSVKLKSNDTGTADKQNVVITFRITKNPRPGDKFASRAGQKGICSFLWPTENMPFSESGVVPDILFNPHGFPSRMTIAMMIELMAGKAGSLHGLVHDATPFKFSEEDKASHYFGQQLEKAGYNYYGTDRMYSGVDGRELTADIFFGVIYYQRLRHMVSEKWQVRSTGATEAVKRQPIKGRRRGGGVRFGEMEKDCLISHGASQLLQDRLFFGSDGSYTDICRACHSILSPCIEIPKLAPGKFLSERPRAKCRTCGSEDSVAQIAVPYVFKYLTEQLASVNIKIRIESKFPYSER